MKNFKKYLAQVGLFLCSLKMAVINLILLGLISAAGSFYESYYDLNTAQILVYKSIWMQLSLFLLSVNLIGVLVHRWPWKKRHTSFVMAHFGILILILGSLITQYKGVDGSLRLEIGSKGRSISLPEEVFIIYSSFDGDRWSEISRLEPQFLKNPPSLKSPYEWAVDSSQVLRIEDYYPYALESTRIEPDPKEGYYVQYQLKGANAEIVDFIYKNRRQPFLSKKLGPAHIVFKTGAYKSKQKHELVLTPYFGKTLRYSLISDQRVREKGQIRVGSSIQTGWMDLELKILQYYRARKEYYFKKLKKPTELSVPALKIRFMDRERWMRLNSFLSFYFEDRAYIVGYMNKKHSLGMDLKLKHFKITRYPNSSKAKEYESFVEVDGEKEFLISMNSPLTYKGWTVYQSGFEEDEEGQVVASIFAINKDPGRYIKYLGSLLIICGIFALFYVRRR